MRTFQFSVHAFFTQLVNIIICIYLLSPRYLHATTAPDLDELLNRIHSGELDPNTLAMPEMERRIIFANIDSIYPTRELHASSNPYPLATKIKSALLDTAYYVGDSEYKISDFLKLEPLMGLLLVKGDTIQLEHYAPDHSAETSWISFSITKAITSTLIGAAINKGFIDNLEDTVADYLPRMRGTPYEGVTLKNILQMSSGIAFNEDYEDPESDVIRAGRLQGTALTDYLSLLPRRHVQGEYFNYSTGESNLLGEILRSAIGNNATTFLDHNIWQSFGMEHKGNWLLATPGGGETGGCCVSASLRDYARFGIFAKNGGVQQSGERSLARTWIREATTPSESNPEYGYQWWLYPNGAFAAGGIFGQMIYIDPARDVVIALHSNAPAAVDTTYHAHYYSAINALATAAGSGK